MLWQASQELQRSDVTDCLEKAYFDERTCNFNSGLLVFLPKKPSRHDEFGNPVYGASDTRPLCMVDTANRILANAARLRWEHSLNDWLAKAQHGFLPRRSLLAKVVEFETATMHYSLEHEASTIMLFDFSAAFPSICQEFIFHA